MTDISRERLKHLADTAMSDGLEDYGLALEATSARIKELTDFCADFAQNPFEEITPRDGHLPPDERGDAMTPYDTVSAWQDEARDLVGGGSVQDRTTPEAVQGAVKPLEWEVVGGNTLAAETHDPRMTYEIMRRGDGSLQFRIDAGQWKRANGRSEVKLASDLDDTHADRVKSLLTTPPADAERAEFLSKIRDGDVLATESGEEA